ncbi:MAG: hypothetical protein V1913_03005 [Fibrobacterota bacterium]
MKTLTGLVKALVLIGLIFGVLYFGIDYYYASRKPVHAAVQEQRPVVIELQVLKEQMAEFEQAISDLQRENKPYEDEAEALEGIKEKISRLKKEVHAPVPALVSSVPAAEAGAVPTEGIFSDTYQKVFLGIIGFLLLFILVLVIYSKLRASPARAPEPAPKRAATPSPPRTQEPAASIAGLSDDQANRLRETMDKFRAAAAPVLRQAETRELEISGIKEAAPEPAAPVSLRIGNLPPDAAPLKSSGNEMIDQVFELTGQGHTVSEISEKLHIDQDQVRLILRFKQS